MTKFLKTLGFRQSLSAIFIVDLLLYLISLLTNLNIGVAVFGLALLFYFPGKFIIGIIPLLDLNFGKFGRFSLNILYSFCYISAAAFLVQSSLGFNTDYQIWVVIYSNIVLFLLYVFLPRLNFWNKIVLNKIGKKRYSITWHDFIPLIVFALVVIAPIIVNPLVQDTDGYFTSLIKSISLNFNIETSRPLFITLPGVTSKFLRLDIAFVYRNLHLALFFFLSLMFYDYLKRNIRSQWTIALLYLSLLAPSVILSEMNIIRPQVAMLALTVPVLVLATESVKIESVLISIISLAVSIVALLYHELSAVLVLIAFMALCINIMRLIFVEKKITWKQAVLILVIVVPYLKILGIFSMFGKAVFMGKYASHFLTGINWRWWFINNYTTMDGFNLGWPGISALYYYLYNGFLLLLLLIFLYFLLFKRRIKVGLHVLLPVMYMIIFLSAAELLPRIGLFFVPNRAWVHLMIAAVIVLTLLVEKFEEKQLKLKFLPVILASLILIGSGGSLYVARNSNYDAYREELAVAKYIKNFTPKDSIILSSQDNSTLITSYADRYYDRLDIDHLINKYEFEDLVQNELPLLSKDKVEVIQPEIIRTIEKIKNDQVYQREVTILQSQKNSVIKAPYNGSNAVYFLYSYRKLGGLNSTRSHLKNAIDSINKTSYEKLGYQIVYSDKNVVLLKVR